MKVKGKIRLLLLTAALMASGLLAWAIKLSISHKQVSAKTVKIKKDSVAVKISYDPALLKKFEALSKLFGEDKKAYTYAGIVNIANGADSSHNIKNLNFLFCKDANSCYAKTGPTETYNGPGLYLYLEHSSKRAIISGEKKMDTPLLPDMGKLTDNLQNEHYELKDSKAGPNETISLLNEHHISCKEYALTYDTLNHHVSRIYIRLTNLHWPMDKAKEKVMDIRFTRFDSSADVSAHMDINKIAYKDGDQWKLMAPYKNYELIRIP